MKLGVLVAAIVAGSLVVACGGDDDDSGGRLPTSAGGNGSGAEPTTAGGGGGGGGIRAQSAVVVVGDTRYEFDMSIQCLVAFGAMGGAGVDVENPENQVNISLPPENWETSEDDWDPPSIIIRRNGDDDYGDWSAGGGVAEEMIRSGQLPAGSSQVDSFSFDGRRASGTATFIDVFGQTLAASRGEDPPGPERGSFELNCEE